MSMADQVLERTNVRPIVQAPTTQILPKRLELEKVIEMYKAVGRRNAEYFHWIHSVYSWICLPCVGFECRKALGEDKTKMMIFDVLLDDLADNYDTRNQALMEEFLQIPWQDSRTKNEYLDVGNKIWEDYIGSVVGYPRFRDFEKVFYFDLRQALAAMVYSSLVNSFNLDNSVEMSVYSPHGCMVMLAVDMDLMCSPTFDIKDLGKMRKVSYLAQEVAHIGNMLITYPGELAERDLSCPIISLAVRKGLIEKEELGDMSVLPRIKKLEEIFKKRAQSHIQKVSVYEKEILSVNIGGFSKYLAELFEKFAESSSLR